MFKYPKTPQYRDFVKEMKNERYKLGIIGTVKLHGTNGSVQFPENIPFSRNNGLNIGNDNFGFAKFHDDNKNNFLDIYKYILTQYPHIPLSANIIIYGEWAGKGIQQDVAISLLPRKFYIFNILVEEADGTKYWLKEFKIAKVCEDIVSIRDYGSFYLSYDPNDPDELVPTLEALTAEIERECLVAKHQGVSGTGEGIVWTAYFNNGEMFNFKIKGAKHCTNTKKRKLLSTPENIEDIKELAELVVTEERLSQIFNQLEYSRKDIGKFIKDVMDDVFSEESDVIENSSISKETLAPQMVKIIKNYILKKV